MTVLGKAVELFIIVQTVGPEERCWKEEQGYAKFRNRACYLLSFEASVLLYVRESSCLSAREFLVREVGPLSSSSTSTSSRVGILERIGAPTRRAKRGIMPSSGTQHSRGEAMQTMKLPLAVQLLDRLQNSTAEKANYRSLSADSCNNFRRLDKALTRIYS